VLDAISPFFIVRDVLRSIAFYRDKLGFEVVFLNSTSDPFFAILKRGGAQLLVKAPDASVVPLPNCERHPLARWDAFVDTSDPDALASELQRRNVDMHVPSENEEDGLRGFQVRDPDGYVLYFGCPV
jgi:catechol 2,3-dioxygenase-like lactoylglutathione lyase family enzyme